MKRDVEIIYQLKTFYY